VFVGDGRLTVEIGGPSPSIFSAGTCRRRARGNTCLNYVVIQPVVETR